MKAQLLPLSGGEPVEIAKDMTLIGRREDCDICLDHRSVSKAHCILVKTEGLLYVRDLGSTNGTKVNGQRVRRAALLPGDQLAVAGEKFTVQFGVDRPLHELKTEILSADALAQIENRVTVAGGRRAEPDLEEPSGDLPHPLQEPKVE